MMATLTDMQTYQAGAGNKSSGQGKSRNSRKKMAKPASRPSRAAKRKVPDSTTYAKISEERTCRPVRWLLNDPGRQEFGLRCACEFCTSLKELPLSRASCVFLWVFLLLV
jgi:hypothetical protein